jgi:hypothetical protein
VQLLLYSPKGCLKSVTIGAGIGICVVVGGEVVVVVEVVIVGSDVLPLDDGVDVLPLDDCKFCGFFGAIKFK